MQDAIATVFLRRQNDRDHVYRRMDVYEQDEKSLVFESNFFAGEPDLFRTAMTSIDSKRAISRQLHQEIERLCREDGFRVISRGGFNCLRAEVHEIE